MTIIAFIILGLVALNKLPISLMPDIDVPEIKIYYAKPNASAQEIENVITKRLRHNLQQVVGLKDIQTESFDGGGKIVLKFQFGTKIDIAFLSVNEKVDIAMNGIPKDIPRPIVVKSSVSDIPVLYVNVNHIQVLNEEMFIEFSSFVQFILKKRLEQLEDVAIADINGVLNPELYIIPDQTKMKSLQISQDDIKNAIENNNRQIGSLSIRDGYFHYSIRFNAELISKKDVENIYLNIHGRLLQIKDIAKVGYRSRDTKGYFYDRNKQAISIAIIKQSKARVSEMKEAVQKTLSDLTAKHPEITYSFTKDQAQLLNYSINNLKQSLLLGIILAIIVMLFFQKNRVSSVIIAFSIPTSVVISIFFFNLFSISINTISLSGLIIGVGLMIDNSIIVIDNITQHRERGNPLFKACVNGTNEIIRPLISSVLTTCAIFIPLLFLSGISGSLFYDQAMAVSIGLFVSFIISITIIPVLYYILLNKNRKRKTNLTRKKTLTRFTEELYTKGFYYFFSKKILFLICCLILVSSGILILNRIKIERIPAIEVPEKNININWNTSIHIEENEKRAKNIIAAFENRAIEINCHIGEKSYIFDNNKNQDINQVEFYVKTETKTQLSNLLNDIKRYVAFTYPNAIIKFNKVDNLFEKIFKESDESLLTAYIDINDKSHQEITKKTKKFTESIRQAIPGIEVQNPPSIERVIIEFIPERLALYHVSHSQLVAVLQKSILKKDISMLKAGSIQTPISISKEQEDLQQIIQDLKVKNNKNKMIPVSSLVHLSSAHNFKTILGRKEGNVIKIELSNINYNEVPEVIQILKQTAYKLNMQIYFSGRYFSGKRTLAEMSIILLLVLLMLYFILAAQFESLSLPFIVLLEIPIDIGGAIVILWLCGESLNIMAMIGLIVMTGIVINDSILKIDTINKLRKKNYSLTEAIHEGSIRRLKPILITSLTTIFAMTPFLFGNDLGSQLQKPLAISLIAGMFIGTFISLYFIPICYYLLLQKNISEQ